MNWSSLSLHNCKWGDRQRETARSCWQLPYAENCWGRCEPTWPKPQVTNTCWTQATGRTVFLLLYQVLFRWDSPLPFIKSFNCGSIRKFQSQYHCIKILTSFQVDSVTYYNIWNLALLRFQWNIILFISGLLLFLGVFLRSRLNSYTLVAEKWMGPGRHAEWTGSLWKKQGKNTLKRTDRKR